MRNCEDIVDEQIRAYERGDLPAFLATYEEDATCMELPSGHVIARGLEEIGRVWGKLFERGARTVEISQRIVHGRFVTDHEHVSSALGGPTISAVAVYHVGPAAIRRVWFLEERADPAS